MVGEGEDAIASGFVRDGLLAGLACCWHAAHSPSVRAAADASFDRGTPFLLPTGFVKGAQRLKQEMHKLAIESGDEPPALS